MIFLIFDGGRNKELGCYGSYMVLEGKTLNGARILHHVSEHRFCDVKTSNEAEYTALIIGLEWVSEHVFVKPQHIKITIIGDSALVLNQSFGGWRVNALNLWPLRSRVVELTSKFGEVTVIEWPREAIVVYLGH